MSEAAALSVIDPGVFSTVQDAGRRGYQRFGVAEAGAIDRASLRLANWLVGNDPEEAALELSLVGGSYECRAESCRVALTGAVMPADLGGRPVPHCAALRLARGERLTLGPARRGARSYLAVEGGFDLAPILGSLSTHVRSGLGGLDGRALATGDSLPLRRGSASPDAELRLSEPDWLPVEGPVRIVFGPQDDHFTERARRDLVEQRFLVSGRSDRMACRLEGASIEHAGDFNIVSDAIANGSIQVTGTGSPVVLLADRQTTGGYPKIATVIAADLRLLGQRRAGEPVRFRSVTLEEAEAAWRDAEARFAKLRLRLQAHREPGELTAADLLSRNLISGVVGEF